VVAKRRVELCCGYWESESKKLPTRNESSSPAVAGRGRPNAGEVPEDGRTTGRAEVVVDPPHEGVCLRGSSVGLMLLVAVVLSACGAGGSSAKQLAGSGRAPGEIAYFCGLTTLCLVGGDGSNPRATNQKGQGAVLSPDGRHVARVFDNGGRDSTDGRLEVGPSTGLGNRTVWRFGQYALSWPAWSPDGSRLAASEPGTGVVGYRAPAVRVPARWRREVMPSFRYTFRRW
jgi:hypothetical protein